MGRPVLARRTGGTRTTPGVPATGRARGRPEGPAGRGAPHRLPRDDPSRPRVTTSRRHPGRPAHVHGRHRRAPSSGEGTVTEIPFEWTENAVPEVAESSFRREFSGDSDIPAQPSRATFANPLRSRIRLAYCQIGL